MRVDLPGEAKKELDAIERLQSASRRMMKQLEAERSFMSHQDEADCATIYAFDARLQVAIRAAYEAVTRWTQREIRDVELIAIVFEPSRIAEETWPSLG
jgi:hypothetical protein